YGLKQSPRCWNKAFKEYMVSIGFKQSEADPCIFVRSGENFAVVAVYIDDLIKKEKNDQEMKDLKRSLEAKFKMKDMGNLHYCLGISVVQEEDQLILHQKQYLLNLLKRYGLEEVTPVSTPADVNVTLEKDDSVSKDVDQMKYQSIWSEVFCMLR
ncbi:MAG: hypothetical protein GY696_10785, partial [Gammaproteobacteria bacterium]|nr:hypothetical protein [Gammaproteobacteria bacterium]